MSKPPDYLAAKGHVMAQPLFAMQPPSAAAAFAALYADAQRDGQPIARIIEIGTGPGGLALYLAKTFPDCHVLTYDVEASGERDVLLKRHGAAVHHLDVFSRAGKQQLTRQIRKPGRTLLLCDGGDKRREFACYCEALKDGDLIMVHDYAPSKLQFVDHLRGKRWNWCELTYPDIADTCRRNQIVAVAQPQCAESAWGVFCKDEDAAAEDIRAATLLEPKDVVLVFATINRCAVHPRSPQYLHASLASMLAADPLVHRAAGIHLVVGNADVGYVQDYFGGNTLLQIHPCPQEQLNQQRDETPHNKLTRTYIRCLDTVADSPVRGAFVFEDDCRFRDGWLRHALEAANEMRQSYADSMLALYSTYTFEGIGGFYRGRLFCSYGPPFFGLVGCYYDRTAAASAAAYLRRRFGERPADLLIADWSNLCFNRYAVPRSLVQHMGAISAGTSGGSMNNSGTFNLPIRPWGPGWTKPT